MAQIGSRFTTVVSEVGLYLFIYLLRLYSTNAEVTDLGVGEGALDPLQKLLVYTYDSCALYVMKISSSDVYLSICDF